VSYQFMRSSYLSYLCLNEDFNWSQVLVVMTEYNKFCTVMSFLMMADLVLFTLAVCSLIFSSISANSS